MAVQEERIVLNAEAGPAIAATKKANDALEKYEKTAQRANKNAGRSAQKAADVTVRATDRTIQSVKRLADNYEKKLAVAGLTGAQKRLAARDALIKRLHGEEKAIKQVTAAHAKYEARLKSAGTSNRRFGESTAWMAAQVVVLGAALKAVIVDSTLYAARTEAFGVAMRAAGKAAGLSRAEVVGAERSVKKLGISTQHARQSISRLITSEIDLADATKLARLAQNAAVIGNINSSEAFTRLVYAIQSGQPEMLRTMGINATFERSYARLAKEIGKTANELTEMEKLQVRTNIVLEQAPRFAGIYEASLESVGKRLNSLKRHIEEYKNAIGGQYQGYLGAGVDLTEGLAKAAQKAPREVADIQNILGVAAATGVAAKMGGPKAAAAVGAIGGLALAVGRLKDEYDDMLGRYPEIEKFFTGETRAAKELKETLADVNSEAVRFRILAQPMKEGGVGVLVNPRSRDPFSTAEGGFGEKIEAERERVAKEAKAKAEQLAKQHARALIQTRDGLAKRIQQAQVAELTGTQLIVAQRDLELQQLREKKLLTKDIAAQVKELTTQRLMALGGRQLKKSQAAGIQADIAAASGYAQNQAGFAIQTLQSYQRTATQRERLEIKAAETAGAAQLRQAEMVSAVTLRQKVAMEEQKADIETKTLLHVFRLKMDLLDKEQEAELRTMETVARARGINENLIAKRRDSIIRANATKASDLELATNAKLDRVRESAAVRSADLVRDHQERAFDHLRDSVGNMFDALTVRTQSFGQALANAIKLPMLAMMKEIVSSHVAKMLMRLTSGGGGGFGGGGFAGLGRLAMPALGGGMLPGAPGGTSGFAGPVGGAGGAGGVLGGFGGFGGAGSMLHQLGGLGMKGVGQGVGVGSGLQFGSGIGGSLGGGLLLGGGGLITAGMARGGWSGVGMTTAGGALIGTKIMPGIGTAIGAGVGFAAGMIRRLFKGREEKIREKVRAVYSVGIRDKGVLGAIGDIAKGFGSLDLGIRSPQVRELVELYADTTGQSFGGRASGPTPASFAHASGQLFQAGGGGFASLPSISIPTPTAQPATIVVQSLSLSVDGQGAADFLDKRMVDKPQAVAGAIVQAGRASVGRREQAALALQPGLVTS